MNRLSQIKELTILHSITFQKPPLLYSSRNKHFIDLPFKLPGPILQHEYYRVFIHKSIRLLGWIERRARLDRSHHLSQCKLVIFGFTQLPPKHLNSALRVRSSAWFLAFNARHEYKCSIMYLCTYSHPYLIGIPTISSFEGIISFITGLMCTPVILVIPRVSFTSLNPVKNVNSYFRTLSSQSNTSSVSYQLY